MVLVVIQAPVGRGVVGAERPVAHHELAEGVAQRNLRQELGHDLALLVVEVRLGYPDRQISQTVVDEFSLTVESGRIACLLGPSGCGKTTVLRAIAGFEPCRVGSIHVGDRLLSSVSVHVAPELRHVGMMFQEYALFPHLSAAANVGFGLRRLAPGPRAERVDEMLRLVGLADRSERFPHELSGGQQQRIALARALAPSPDVLLLNEPFCNLDAETRARLAAQTRAILTAAGQTAIVVTHKTAEARAMADMVVTMAPR